MNGSERTPEFRHRTRPAFRPLISYEERAALLDITAKHREARGDAEGAESARINAACLRDTEEYYGD